MKALLIAVTFLCSAIISHSQLRIAIAAGGHVSDVKEDNDMPGYEETLNGYSGRTGAHFGFIADLRIGSSNFYFQPGVLFFSKGRKFADSIVNTGGEFYQTRKQFINYIDLPLNFVYKIPIGKKSKFILGAGPYASFFYNGKETSETFGANSFFESSENEDLPVGDAPGKYKVFNFGVNGLAGIEFNRVFLTANYSRGLNDFFRSPDHDGGFKHQVIGGTLGIFIGRPVETEVKIKDKDSDGIPDDKDACPANAGPIVTNGCPDSDGDGIADKDDQCPTQPGTLANRGCPVLDRDNDGVIDEKDKCPDIPGLARLEGCPSTDTDRDGINDEEDKCPTVPGLGRYEGCPVPDRDQDGVDDENDRCPDIKGNPQKDGCPDEIKKEIVEKVNFAAKKIQFQVNKADLTSSSYRMLDDVVAILKQDGNLKLLIEGHTSADGGLESNMRLSQARADAVKTYIISKGIEPSRLSAVGLGPTRPLNNGRTAAEKALNRRVELKLSN